MISIQAFSFCRLVSEAKVLVSDAPFLVSDSQVLVSDSRVLVSDSGFLVSDSRLGREQRPRFFLLMIKPAKATTKTSWKVNIAMQNSKFSSMIYLLLVKHLNKEMVIFHFA